MEMAGSKYITIGRHNYTWRQLALLKEAGLEFEAARVEKIEPKEISDLMVAAREKGAEAIVVQGLPMHLLFQVWQGASRHGIRVLMFKTEPADEDTADIVIPSREGGYRYLRTVALQEIKRIVVDTEDIATIDE